MKPHLSFAAARTAFLTGFHRNCGFGSGIASIHAPVCQCWGSASPCSLPRPAPPILDSREQRAVSKKSPRVDLRSPPSPPAPPDRLTAALLPSARRSPCASSSPTSVTSPRRNMLVRTSSGSQSVGEWAAHSPLGARVPFSPALAFLLPIGTSRHPLRTLPSSRPQATSLAQRPASPS